MVLGRVFIKDLRNELLISILHQSYSAKQLHPVIGSGSVVLRSVNTIISKKTGPNLDLETFKAHYEYKLTPNYCSANFIMKQYSTKIYSSTFQMEFHI